jgi:hypothetical protein
MSYVIYVDFGKKRITREEIILFDKVNLLHAGLINYERLQRRGEVHEVKDDTTRNAS